MPARADVGTPPATWRPGFLAALSLTGNVSQAARAVGITRRHAHRVRQHARDFAQQWAEAMRTATEGLLCEARRAVATPPPARAYDLRKLSPPERAQLAALTRKLSVLAAEDG